MDGGSDIDSTVVCVQLSAKLVPQNEEDNRYWWVVTAVYSNDAPDEGIPAQTFVGSVGIGSQANPWQEPPMYRYESEVIQRADPNDLEGNPYVNSAQQPFTPPFTVERARRILTITRNQETFDFALADAYSFAVNSDDFSPLGTGTPVPPGCAQCFPIHAEHAQRGIISFWRVTYRIRIGATFSRIYGHVLGVPLYVTERESFRPVRILDAGMCRLQTSILQPGFMRPIPIIGPGGYPISQPVLLDGSGQPATASTITGRIPATYREFKPYPAKPFTPILTTGIG